MSLTVALFRSGIPPFALTSARSCAACRQDGASHRLRSHVCEWPKKKTLAVAAAAAVLTTAPLVTPVKAQGVDVQIGRDRYDRYDRDRRYDSDTTVGLGPGGITIGPRQRCRMETITIERDDGRTITRRERRCD
jgi:hypothetical protein